ncbi:MAG: hypothetical protein ACH350_03280 [Parachlamydiaceae bacterium]
MKKLRPLFTLTLAFTLGTASIYGQNSCCQEDENYSCAYVESSNTANWTVYIPITLIVGAAIWFGLADHSKNKGKKNDSQDGLGRIIDSKRISHSGYSRSNDYRSLTTRSKTTTYGSFSHSN